jgi:hypothetical protein
MENVEILMENLFIVSQRVDYAISVILRYCMGMVHGLGLVRVLMEENMLLVVRIRSLTELVGKSMEEVMLIFLIMDYALMDQPLNQFLVLTSGLGHVKVLMVAKRHYAMPIRLLAVFR